MGDDDGFGRVLDLTDESGAFATRILADLGAEVIRVEAPGGDRIRSLAPFLGGDPDPDTGFAHLYLDAGKASVVVDRHSPAGQREWVRLVQWADAIVETERLDHDDLARLNPGIVHVTVTPFGLDGPWSEWKGCDLVATAASGLAWVCGKPGDPPNQPGADQAHKMAGLAAACATVFGLHARRQEPASGGIHVDISQQTAAAMATVQTSNPHFWLWRKIIPKRPGLTAVHQCSDGRWATLMVRPDRVSVFLDWCREIGVRVDASEAELRDPFGGTVRLTRLIREVAARYPRDEFYDRAWALGLIGLPVNTLPDLEECQHLREIGAFVAVDHTPVAPSLPFPPSPVAAVAGPLVRAPLLGEHQPILEALEPRQPPDPTGPAMDLTRALDGVRIVDFCWVLAGPLGTRLLANFGAEVIRVEAGARSYDDHFPDGYDDPALGAFHNAVNTNKKSVTIDPRTDRGRELLLRLIGTADIVTNNYRPGSFEEMGFGYDVLRERNPGIISIHMPGCGRSGPWRDRGSFGNMVAAASGLSWLTGFPGRAPRGLGVAHPDFTGPYLLAMTAVAALRRRSERGGMGEELEVNQLLGTLSLIGTEWLQYAATGTPPPMRANRDPNWCPHGIYPADGEDQWVAVAADDGSWDQLCEVLEVAGLAHDSRFLTHQDRKANEDDLDELVAEWTARRSKWEAAERLQAVGVAAAPVVDLADAVERDPNLSRWIERVRRPEFPEVEIPIPGEAIQIVGARRSLPPAPRFGQHNDYVLREVLGLPPEEVAALRDDGVVW